MGTMKVKRKLKLESDRKEKEKERAKSRSRSPGGESRVSRRDDYDDDDDFQRGGSSPSIATKLPPLPRPTGNHEQDLDVLRNYVHKMAQIAASGGVHGPPGTQIGKVMPVSPG